METKRKYPVNALGAVFLLSMCILYYNYHFMPQAYLGAELCFLLLGVVLSLHYKTMDKELLVTTGKSILRFYLIYAGIIIAYCIQFGGCGLGKIIENLLFLSIFTQNGKHSFISTPYWFVMTIIWVGILFLVIVKKMEPAKRNLLLMVGVLYLYIAFRNQYSYINMTYEHSIAYLPVSLVRGVVGTGIGYLFGQWYQRQGKHVLEYIPGIVLELCGWGSAVFIFHAFTANVTPGYDFIIEIPGVLLLCCLLKQHKHEVLFRILNTLGRFGVFRLAAGAYLLHPFVADCFLAYGFTRNEENLLYYLGILCLASAVLLWSGQSSRRIASFVTRISWRKKEKSIPYIPEEPTQELLQETEENVIINVEHVTIRFNLASQKVDNLKEYCVKLLKQELMFQEFFAVKDVSFQVKKGEAWGIIGVNGSGKSTILKAISGILKPYQGKVQVAGTIAPLLELGAGFDGNLTARENIILNGCVLGYTEEFMRAHFDEIVEFAGLGEFLDSPVKNFSSGMSARLGFAIATVVCPDILIVDEVLSVGDIRFREKCERRIKEMLESKTTLLYVSHSIPEVKRLCSKAIWLDKGRMVMQGEADKVCSTYLEKMTGVR